MECTRCGGIGLVRTATGSMACECQAEAGALARIGRAKIPPGFEQVTLENFQPCPHTKAALLLARCYVEEFGPANKLLTDNRPAGMLMSGTVGTGKTHLAVGIAKAIARRGFRPLFVDVRELLERLRHTYDKEASETQYQVMAPIFAADLVVIDELGAQRPTDWSFETVELLIGGLYNRMVPTVITTNLQNLAAGAAEGNGYSRAARPETLGDRIGARMWSRLQQMCRQIEMNGPDWRVKK